MWSIHLECLDRFVLDSANKTIKELESSYPFPLNNQNNILANFLRNLTEFRDQIKNLTYQNPRLVHKHLKEILGLGEGSTPISDDFLLGVLATYYFIEPNNDKQFELLAHFPYEKYTTNKSSKLIRLFLRRNFPKDLQKYLTYLTISLDEESQIHQFQKQISKISSIGTSSGKYFLLGSRWELKHRIALNNK